MSLLRGTKTVGMLKTSPENRFDSPRCVWASSALITRRQLPIIFWIDADGVSVFRVSCRLFYQEFWLPLVCLLSRLWKVSARLLTLQQLRWTWTSSLTHFIKSTMNPRHGNGNKRRARDRGDQPRGHVDSKYGQATEGKTNWHSRTFSLCEY